MGIGVFGAKEMWPRYGPAWTAFGSCRDGWHQQPTRGRGGEARRQGNRLTPFRPVGRDARASAEEIHHLMDFAIWSAPRTSIKKRFLRSDGAARGVCQSRTCSCLADTCVRWGYIAADRSSLMLPGSADPSLASAIPSLIEGQFSLRRIVSTKAQIPCSRSQCVWSLMLRNICAPVRIYKNIDLIFGVASYNHGAAASGRDVQPVA